MVKLRYILLGIFAACVTLFVILFLHGKLNITKYKIIYPLSNNGFSIFSMMKNKEKPKYIVYGYLPYWSLDRSKFIQYNNLTDIAYFGLYIDQFGDFETINNEGYAEQGYYNWKNNKDLDQIIKKSKQNDVRFALTIISHVDEISDSFLSCKSCWDNLLKNTIAELKSKGIKDVNINFEYVEQTTKESQKQFSEFVLYFNKGLDKEFGQSYVVVTSFADSIVKTRITDIAEVGNYADGIFIMAYDFHRPTSDITGPVAPIGGKGVHAEYDIQTMLDDYLAVTPPNKIILGVPYYGYNWVVSDQQIYSRRIDGNDEIGFSQSQTYESIMDNILEINPEIRWDDLGKSPYFTYVSPETGSIREVFFDDARSLQEKYILAKNKGLAGVGIWALGYDGGYVELWDLLQQQFVEK